jgi:hypothetical protein
MSNQLNYNTGNLILASDYNGILGGSPSSTPNTINTVWAVGSGSAGYGQTALSNVAVSGTVVASQWSTLIQTLNSIRTHQTGSGTGVTLPTAGTTIAYLAVVNAAVDTAYTSRLSFATNAAVTVGGNLTSTWSSATTSLSLSRSFGVKCTFASADQTRYFFNSGGRIRLNLFGAQNASTTTRTNNVITMLQNVGGIGIFGANTNGGRLGTGGTLNSSNVNVGYHTSTFNSNVSLISLNSATAAYTSDTISVSVRTTGTPGTNNDKGNQIDMWIDITSTSGANAGSLTFDDALGVDVIRRIDISYPATTSLANTWGAVTVTAI